MDELNRKSVEDFKSAEKNNLVLLLDNVRSLHNVGSAFRTADAFLVKKIFLCGITGSPPNREIHKTALGAEESVDWEHHPNSIELIQILKSEGYKIVCIEQTDKSISLKNFTPREKDKYCFVFGNEVFGVDQQLIDVADFTIEIPQYGTKHSLNVSVSIGIVIWDYITKALP
ncbi:MAG: RNA methyltransferase [Cytophagaceae bacterium]|nr:RNA methyltransferase [Cytophagaceae bacterium]